MKKLILFSTLFCLNAFAANDNSEFDLNVINQTALCSGKIQKKLDLGKMKIQRKLIARKIEETKACAAKYALDLLYQKCQEINQLSEVEFASSPNLKKEECDSSLIKIKGLDYFEFKCQVQLEVACLNQSITN